MGGVKQWGADAFTGVRKVHGMAISMDGRGRALDHIVVERLWRSVKYDGVYLRGYATLPELLAGLTDYFVLSNTERIHQSLNDVTPDEVYRTASGGGSRVVDQCGETATRPQKHNTKQTLGQRRSAACKRLPS